MGKIKLVVVDDYSKICSLVCTFYISSIFSQPQVKRARTIVHINSIMSQSSRNYEAARHPVDPGYANGCVKPTLVVPPFHVTIKSQK